MAKPEVVLHDLTCLTNDYAAGSNISPIVNGLANEHRTLQQSFTGHFILNFIRLMAKKFMAGDYDARNEMACKLCSRMWNQIKDEVEPVGYDKWVRLPLV